MSRPLMTAVLIAAATPAAAATPLTVSLDWTPTTGHVGLYVAQARGYYADAGLDVEILPYTDTASTALVASEVADFGVFSSLSFYTTRASGADLVATYAVFQHETGRLVFDAGRDDIHTPADLDGLTYGGFGTAWEKTLITTIIQNAGGEGDFDMVTLGTSAYQALAAGRVDFTLEVSTWEGVNAELQGRDQGVFRYADYGVPDQHAKLIGARGAWLEAHPETAEAFVQATQRGYRYAAENPDRAADILIDATSDTLTNAKLVRASMQALVDGDYLLDEDGRAGIIDPAKIAAMGEFLYQADVLKGADGEPLDTEPDFSTWSTNAYLTE